MKVFPEIQSDLEIPVILLDFHFEKLAMKIDIQNGRIYNEKVEIPFQY